MNAHVRDNLLVLGGTDGNTKTGPYTVSDSQLLVGKTGTGTGGQLRHIDDGGTTRWFSGVGGSAGARDWLVFDIVNNAARVTVDDVTGVLNLAAAYLQVGVASPGAGGQVRHVDDGGSARWF